MHGAPAAPSGAPPPALREPHAFRVDEVSAVTSHGVQVRAVSIDEVAQRLDDRAVGPRDGGPELRWAEREARIDQPQRRPTVVRERVPQLRAAQRPTITNRCRMPEPSGSPTAGQNPGCPGVTRDWAQHPSRFRRMSFDASVDAGCRPMETIGQLEGFRPLRFEEVLR
jgi:hypothetical protein